MSEWTASIYQLALEDTASLFLCNKQFVARSLLQQEKKANFVFDKDIDLAVPLKRFGTSL